MGSTIVVLVVLLVLVVPVGIRLATRRKEVEHADLLVVPSEQCFDNREEDFQVKGAKLPWPTDPRLKEEHIQRPKSVDSDGISS